MDASREKGANVDVEPNSEHHGDELQTDHRSYDAKHDQRDMRRLGKQQELKVRLCTVIYLERFVDMLTATIPLFCKHEAHRMTSNQPAF